MSLYTAYRKIVDCCVPYPENGLDFYYERVVSDGYGGENAVAARIPTYKWYLRQRNLGRKYKSIIGGVYGRQLLPVVDADSETDMIRASLWLKENKVKHAIVASSPNRFWIIIDRPGSWNNIVNFLAVPGQDNDYLNLTKERKMCYIRGEMKYEYFIPVVVEESNSEIIDNFVKEVIEHFSSKSVKWLWRLNIYRDNKVDLTNPEEFCLDLTLDEVIK